MQQRADEGSLVLPDQVRVAHVPRLARPVRRDARRSAPAGSRHHARPDPRRCEQARATTRARPPGRCRARRLRQPRGPTSWHSCRGRGHTGDRRRAEPSVSRRRGACREPVYVESLRRAVWTYVGAERDAGTSPGQVVTALTELVDAAGMAPPSMSRALTGRVILWCVEAYFGQLGCDVGRATAEQTAEQGDFSSAHDESEVLVGALPA